MPAAAVDKRQRIMQIREVMTVLFLAVMGWKDWEKRNFIVADRYLWNHWSCL